MNKKRQSKRRPGAAKDNVPADLHIIGGSFRGRRLKYHGDPVTRPMKHRVREALFNLVSIGCKGRHAIDLFAGTGALGLEAIGRGAVGATFIEKHIPTARVVEENIAALEVQDRSTLCVTSAFLWGKRDLPQEEDSAAPPSSFPPPPSDVPWIVFCSPPYAFFVDRQEDMLELINALVEHAPVGSIFLVEADERFDFNLLPGGVAEHRKDPGWDVRTYSPAVVGVWEKNG
ncbi:RsmD family RNA methyltransferase [Adhaeretor mobilis]|uniref:Ribosomal RNA small subunit methyltransferase D n=1 Tax=Adhaeretor mobilis TaxID=1930276 RepID=A0A517MPK9_9BACT|nr:RsmD family RNA methyltransferase [Adhaeretor mobilis]QDS96818.1 Ribosomal RNA small subunit methyltransferase D [Adhaeretor mobilis]